jgi:hypothetical protein
MFEPVLVEQQQFFLWLTLPMRCFSVALLELPCHVKSRSGNLQLLPACVCMSNISVDMTCCFTLVGAQRFRANDEAAWRVLNLNDCGDAAVLCCENSARCDSGGNEFRALATV